MSHLRRVTSHVPRRLTFVLVLSLLLALLPSGPLPTTPPIAHAATDCAAQTDIPQVECEALLALYNATDGPNWLDNSGWNVTNTPCSWYGVTCASGHVTEIGLSSNQLNGAIPPELGSLANLEYLSFSNLDNRFRNRLSGMIPPELGNLTNLTQLLLDDNTLSGTIPPELGNLTNLTRLDLGFNQLSGAIPSELGNLTNLIGLNLGSNQLSGAIPSELGNLINLTSLHLFDNMLSGAIPLELSNLANLEYLVLDDNMLSGTIPPELGNLKSLITLSLSRNMLSGLIPPQLSNLEGVNFYTYIEYNYLNTNVTDQNLLDWLNAKFSDWQLQYGDPGSITGSVQSPDSTPLPGIMVAVYAEEATPPQEIRIRSLAATTTGSDGKYQLDGVPSNIPLSVRFSDPSGTYATEWYNDAADLESAAPVTVTAAITTPDINATLEEAVAPLADATSDTGSVTSDPKSGAITVRMISGTRSAVTITHQATCPASTPTSVTLQLSPDGVPTDYPMAQVDTTATYTATIPQDQVAAGNLTVQVACSDSTNDIAIGRIVLYDPSGDITDAVTGAPVAGARVTLYTLPDWEPKTSATDDRANTCHTIDTRPGSTWDGLPPARSLDASLGVLALPESGRIDPALNPQVTGADGRYGWDVAGGCWYIEVRAEGYTTQISPVVGVPPEVTDLDLALTPTGPGTQSGRTLYLPMIQR